MPKASILSSCASAPFTANLWNLLASRAGLRHKCGMAKQVPVVLLSAGTPDLRSHRAEARRVLEAAGYRVEEMDWSAGPSYATSEQLVTGKLKSCDAVIHLAGTCHGAEPEDLPTGAKRLSYAQMEHHVASRRKIPCYTFLLAPEFHYDPHMPEEPEKRWLQAEHRRAIEGRTAFREVVADASRLTERLRHTSFRLHDVRTLLDGEKCHARLFLLATLLVLGGIAALAWVYWRQFQ